MLFVGIDLAWSTRNGSGISIIKGDKTKAEVMDAKVVYSDEEILSFVKSNVASKEALIAIDAPLIVPNAEGRRKCEALVGQFFRKYDAGAHPSTVRLRCLLTRRSGLCAENTQSPATCS